MMAVVHLTYKILPMFTSISEPNFSVEMFHRFIKQIAKPVGYKGMFVTFLSNFVGDDSVLRVVFKQIYSTGIIYGSH